MSERMVDRLSSILVDGGYGRAAWREFWSLARRHAWTEANRLAQRRRAFARWWITASVLGGSVIAFTACVPGVDATGALWRWLLWYLPVSLWTFLHLGLIRDTETNAPLPHFLWPNGLSFLRLGLAPLVADPLISNAGTDGLAALGLITINALVLSDLLDGFLARRLGQTSRLGRFLDPLADIAILAFTAIALWRRDVIPSYLAVLILVRYLGALVAAIVLFLRKGPLPITGTLPGKVTALVLNVLFCGAALALFLTPARLTLVAPAAAVAALFVGANIVYLVWRGRALVAGRTS